MLESSQPCDISWPDILLNKFQSVCPFTGMAKLSGKANQSMQSVRNNENAVEAEVVISSSELMCSYEVLCLKSKVNDYLIVRHTQ